jgi:hypothetical protein
MDNNRILLKDNANNVLNKNLFSIIKKHYFNNYENISNVVTIVHKNLWQIPGNSRELLLTIKNGMSNE